MDHLKIVIIIDLYNLNMMKYNTFRPPSTVQDYLRQGGKLVGKTITLTGKLARIRCQKTKIFGEISDGSCNETLKFIYFFKSDDEIPKGIKEMMNVTAGSSVRLIGKVWLAPERASQLCELQLADATVISPVRNPDTFQYGLSLHKKRSPQELRDHLVAIRSDTYNRFRDPKISAIMRIRGAVQNHLMQLFSKLGFTKIDTPIFTQSDCEGAGEMFTVTTLPLDDVPKTETGKVDFTKDFFKTETHLTVSGQLEAEAVAQVLGKVFTFGPTFRAEHSISSRHLAEFQMLEPELTFTETDEEARYQRLMDLEESMVKCMTDFVLTHCEEDAKLLSDSFGGSLIKMLEETRDTPFGRITYTKAIEILEQKTKEGKVFEDMKIFWGMDLGSEHERYLCEEIYKKPLFVTNYPQDLKSFYMKADSGCKPDRITCQAVDLLIPGIGELCGGSMREDDPEKLIALMDKKDVPVDNLQWYIDLRYDGGLPTGGFGLGFARLISFLTGTGHVKYVVPFPQAYTKQLICLFKKNYGAGCICDEKHEGTWSLMETFSSFGNQGFFPCNEQYFDEMVVHFHQLVKWEVPFVIESDSYNNLNIC